MRGDHLTRRGQVWHAFVYLPSGERVMRSTHCTDRKAARRVAARLQREVVLHPDQHAKGATVKDALDALEQDRRRAVCLNDRSHATVAFYRRKGLNLRRLLGEDTPLEALTRARVEAYIDKRIAEGVCRNTIVKELVTLRSALKVMADHGRYDGIVCTVVPKLSSRYRPDPEAERALTRKEVEQLLLVLARKRAAQIAFFVATGCRFSEGTRALRTDVSADLSTVRIRRTKTQTKAAQSPLPIVLDWQRWLLHFCLDHAKGVEGRLFEPWPNMRRDLANACRKIGVSPRSAVDLRHTFAHWWLLAGASHATVAQMLGQSSTRMLELTYGRLNADELRARALSEVRRADGTSASQRPLDLRTKSGGFLR